jgi:hypothetical protein
MANLFKWINTPQEQRSIADLPLTWDGYQNFFGFGGIPYMVQGGSAGTLSSFTSATVLCSLAWRLGSSCSARQGFSSGG